MAKKQASVSTPQDKPHAKMSPSASERWMNCAASVALNAASTSTNNYAEEGTAAHALLAKCLTHKRNAIDYLGQCVYTHWEVTEEMAEAVQLAIDYVRGYMAQNKKATLHVEIPVDPAKVLGCEAGLTSGTSDVVIDNFPHEIVVMDYKHGVGGVVEVKDNKQLLQYLTGYLSQYHFDSIAKAIGKLKLRVAVVQPRAQHADGPVREHVYTKAELDAHVTRVRQRVIEIKKDPSQRSAGDWCQYCAAAGTCRTLAEFAMEAASLEFSAVAGHEPSDPNTLSPKEVGIALRKATIIERWIKALYAHALHEMVELGHDIPGYKMVRGRTTRGWADTDKVTTFLSDFMKLKEDEFAPRSLVGVAAVEKLIKQNIKAKCAAKGKKPAEAKAVIEQVLENHLKPLVVFSLPGVHIAPLDDPRPRYYKGQEFLPTLDDPDNEDLL